MEKEKKQNFSITIDWSWVGLGYCFFVVFHLLPIVLFYDPYIFSGWLQAVIYGWLFGGLAVIAFLIGFVSRGVTILEAGIAAVVYSITVLAAMSSLGIGKAFSVNGAQLIISAILISILSAWIGETMQSKKQSAKPEN
jgi:hypothetical protein